MFGKKRKAVINKTQIKTESDFKEYQEKGAFWDEQIINKTLKSERLAWKVSFLSMLLAGLSSFALFTLFPLKTVIPYVIEVNKLTGEVQVKRPVDDSPIPQHEAVSKYFLNDYVQTRIGYDRNDFNYRYKKIVAMSNFEVAQGYAEEMSTKNKQSPINLYGERGVVKVNVRQINFVEGDNTVLIRLTKIIKKPAMAESKEEYSVSITFEYSKTAMDEETRLISPLGFKVLRYRITPVLNN